MGLPGHPQGGNDLRGDPRRGGKGREMDPQYNLPNQYSGIQFLRENLGSGSLFGSQYIGEIYKLAR